MISSAYQPLSAKVATQPFKELTEIKSELSYFLEPQAFWTTSEETRRQRHHLIVITEIYYGTGRNREEHVFVLRPDATLAPVDSIDAPALLASVPELGRTVEERIP